MNFEIIPNEQTPGVPYIEGDIKDYIDTCRDELYELKEFAQTLPTCLGLAANQVRDDIGILNIRAFVKKDIETGFFSIIVNPKIIGRIGIPILRTEGCLTWKRKKIVADRYQDITVSYFDMTGEKFVKNISGFNAQIWQHEVDHLDGVEERIEELTWPHTKEHKEGRNDPCPCGSGKKFKKCCWKN